MIWKNSFYESKEWLSGLSLMMFKWVWFFWFAKVGILKELSVIFAFKK